ncbi:MAG TPA: hypothetical protein VKL40_06860 [Candidatus Angelobacter sp.]|nr:hypothetical protein [Candidatus Angelobacter sp.]
MDDGEPIKAASTAKETHLAPLAICLAFSFLLLSVVSCSRPSPAKYPTEVARIPGPAFTIRVSAFPEENGGFVPGQYYRFESLPSGATSWVTALDFRHDDPVPIPRQNIRFLSPQTAFVYMGWRYAVTTDGGKRWDVWNAEKDLPGWQCCNYGLIKEVQLKPNGAGRMILNPIQDRRGEVPELVTSDFGVHWFPPH